MGAQSQQQTVMPAHMNSQPLIQQAQPKQSNMPTNSSSRNSTEPSFSAVLRNLAKQQVDVKDDDMGQTQSTNDNKSSNARMNEKEIDMSRQGNSSRSLPYDSRSHTTIRHPSPEPPEKKVHVIKTIYLNSLVNQNFIACHLDSKIEQQHTQPSTESSKPPIGTINTKRLSTLSAR